MTLTFSHDKNGSFGTLRVYTNLVKFEKRFFDSKYLKSDLVLIEFNRCYLVIYNRAGDTILIQDFQNWKVSFKIPYTTPGVLNTRSY